LLTFGAGMSGRLSLNEDKRDVQFKFSVTVQTQLIMQLNILSAFKFLQPEIQPFPSTPIELLGRKLLGFVGFVPLWVSADLQFEPTFFADVGGTVGIGAGFHAEAKLETGVHIKGWDLTTIKPTITHSFNKFPLQLIANARIYAMAGLGIRPSLLWEDLAFTHITLTPGLAVNIQYNALHSLPQCTGNNGNMMISIPPVVQAWAGGGLNLPDYIINKVSLAKKLKDGINLQVLDLTLSPPLIEHCFNMPKWNFQSSLDPTATIYNAVDSDNDDEVMDPFEADLELNTHYF